MKFLTNRLLRRFGPVGRAADLAVVGGAALKFAQRKGFVSEDTARKLGASNSSAGSAISMGEMALLAMALWRLISQFRSRQRTETIVIDLPK